MPAQSENTSCSYRLTKDMRRRINMAAAEREVTASRIVELSVDRFLESLDGTEGKA